MTILSRIRGIVFDLDGTLYEDTEHFHYYAQRLAARLPAERRAAYWDDLQAIWAGKHVLRLGRVYDRKRDLVLETTPSGTVLRAWDWRGRPLDKERLCALYSAKVRFNMTEMISLGDGWWLPSACAYHHGLKQTYAAYVETKDYLSSERAKLTPLPGLAPWLARLKEHIGLALATNSDLEDTERLLRNLGLTGVFTHVYPEAQKPQKAVAVFQRAALDLNIPPAKLLSIGDNYLNDIYPARQLGMPTCLIDPQGLYDRDTADLVVTSLRDLYEGGEKIDYHY